jgi:hypothetical protein
MKAQRIFEINRPKGVFNYTASIHSPSEGEMTIKGYTRRFTFTVSKGQHSLMRYSEGDNHVEINGKLVQVMYDSWQDFSYHIILNHKPYTHQFNKLLLSRYAHHHFLFCGPVKIGEIYSRINSQLLFFKLGGWLRLELDEGIDFWEPLFFCIAWWWTGYYTDTTST